MADIKKMKEQAKSKLTPKSHGNRDSFERLQVSARFYNPRLTKESVDLMKKNGIINSTKNFPKKGITGKWIDPLTHEEIKK